MAILGVPWLPVVISFRRRRPFSAVSSPATTFSTWTVNVPTVVTGTGALATPNTVIDTWTVNVPTVKSGASITVVPSTATTTWVVNTPTITDSPAVLGLPWPWSFRRRRPFVTIPPVDISRVLGLPWSWSFRRRRPLSVAPPINISDVLGLPWSWSFRRHRIELVPPIFANPMTSVSFWIVNNPVVVSSIITPIFATPTTAIWSWIASSPIVDASIAQPVTVSPVTTTTYWTVNSPVVSIGIVPPVILGLPWSWWFRGRRPFGAVAHPDPAALSWTVNSPTLVTGIGPPDVLGLPWSWSFRRRRPLVVIPPIDTSGILGLPWSWWFRRRRVEPVPTIFANPMTAVSYWTANNPVVVATIAIPIVAIPIPAFSLWIVNTPIVLATIVPAVIANPVTTSDYWIANNPVVTIGTMPSAPAWIRPPVLNYRMIISSLESIPFRLVQSSDHRTPAPGLDPQVLFSSAGQSFKPTSGDVYEIGNGWYGVIPSSKDILGIAPLILFVDSPVAGVDPCTVRIEIIPLSGVASLRVGMARYPLLFYMTGLDHVTPFPGLSPNVLICKSGGDFATPVGRIMEVGHGWYMCKPNVADVDTFGPLVLEATAPGSDPVFEVYDVVGSVMDKEIDRYTLVLLMIRTMLINSGLFSEATCVISLEKQPFSTPSIPSVWISQGGTGFDSELESGGSRYTLLVSPTFTLNVVVRRMQDVEVHDKNWLTHVKRGAYPIIWKIINLLAGKFVYSVAGDLLTTRSLHPIQIGNPYRYNNDPMIAVVPIVFNTNVQIDINLSEPYLPIHN